MQKLLFDRVHGFWASSAIQLQPHELEPARTQRLCSVSPLAAVVSTRQLLELETRRLAAHEHFIAQTEAVSGGGGGQQHAAKTDAKASLGNSRPVAEGNEQPSGSSATMSQQSSWSDSGDLRDEYLNVCPDEFANCPSLSTCPTTVNTSPTRGKLLCTWQQLEFTADGLGSPSTCMVTPREHFPAEKGNRGHAPIRQGAADDHGRVALAEAVERRTTGTAHSTQGTVSPSDPLITAPLAEHQTTGAGSYFLPALFRKITGAAVERSTDNRAVSQTSAVISIHQKLQNSKAIPRSPLLDLPPGTHLGEGWTVADEVELAAAGQEFLDRFGELPPWHICLSIAVAACSVKCSR